MISSIKPMLSSCGGVASFLAFWKPIDDDGFMTLKGTWSVLKLQLVGKDSSPIVMVDRLVDRSFCIVGKGWGDEPWHPEGLRPMLR